MSRNSVRTSVRVVVIEDDEGMRVSLARALQDEGYSVASFADAADPAAILETHPDLALVDVGLGSTSGLALVSWLRARRDIPIVFVTARDAVADRLAGFDLGAEDYVIKPFAIEELLARIRAVLRRTGRLHPSAMNVADLFVDEDAGLATRHGEPLGLTATEFRLLVFLMRNRGRVLSKIQLLSQVWGYEDYDPNVVEVHLVALRRKLEEHGPRLIHTVRGLGYKMTAP